MTEAANACLVLRAEGVGLVLDVTAGRLPSISHWGADLGPLTDADVLALVATGVSPVVNNLVDEPVRVAVLPEHWTG